MEIRGCHSDLGGVALRAMGHVTGTASHKGSVPLPPVEVKSF